MKDTQKIVLLQVYLTVKEQFVLLLFFKKALFSITGYKICKWNFLQL